MSGNQNIFQSCYQTKANQSEALERTAQQFNAVTSWTNGNIHGYTSSASDRDIGKAEEWPAECKKTQFSPNEKKKLNPSTQVEPDRLKQDAGKVLEDPKNDAISVVPSKDTSLNNPIEVLNIVILGRKGVGKSTWINAFANYAKFTSLDDALKADELLYKIPFSFSTSALNKEKQYKNFTVKCGSEDAGESQRTVVYRVEVGKRVVQLINTPGIGDATGKTQDKENMDGIRKAILPNKVLHGILILLKPNDQRLDLMFRSRVKELLTLFHPDAFKNLAFGFTNTRGTNYLPGDTMEPLETLLRELDYGHLEPRPENVFCFDSEGYRCLAARKNDIEFGDLKTYSQSWKQSAKESKRLVKYFEGLTAHELTAYQSPRTSCTSSSSDTQQPSSNTAQSQASHNPLPTSVPNPSPIFMKQVVEMHEKTAYIAQDILTKMQLNERRLSFLNSYDPEIPKTWPFIARKGTICAHPKCIERIYTNYNELTKKYKSKCHPDCGCGQNCKKMLNGNCKVCEHNEGDHFHIDLDQHPEESVKRQLQELQKDLESIRCEAWQLSTFLQSRVDEPDVMIEILEVLEESERETANEKCGSGDMLRRLASYRKDYKGQLKIHKGNSPVESEVREICAKLAKRPIFRK